MQVAPIFFEWIKEIHDDWILDVYIVDDWEDLPDIKNDLEAFKHFVEQMGYTLYIWTQFIL